MEDKQTDTFYPKNRKTWRAWLLKNHDSKPSVWVIYYKKKSGKPTLQYSEAVDEALCFGWIDSKVKPVDEEKFMQFFCKRKPTGTWSKINKEKIQRLIDEKLMTDAGYKTIEAAKANGSWTILDEVEALTIPADLEKEFKKWPGSKKYFLQLSRTDKRNILQWLVLAKKNDTRQKRIIEIAEHASQRLKPKQFRS
ncbi:MAG: YdeI/OmpD-associated family protein [Ferruginibacter sp.]|nr:YdeI/OmpD-associated family protein [Chitinophagaceae bacterium]